MWSSWLGRGRTLPEAPGSAPARAPEAPSSRISLSRRSRVGGEPGEVLYKGRQLKDLPLAKLRKACDELRKDYAAHALRSDLIDLLAAALTSTSNPSPVVEPAPQHSVIMSPSEQAYKNPRHAFSTKVSGHLCSKYSEGGHVS